MTSIESGEVCDGCGKLLICRSCGKFRSPDVAQGTFAAVVVKRLTELVNTADPSDAWEKEAAAEMKKAIHLIPAPAQSVVSPIKAPFHFRRYVNGVEMAEDVEITNASTVQEAFAKARALYGSPRGMDLVLEIAAQPPAAPVETDRLLQQAAIASGTVVQDLPRAWCSAATEGETKTVYVKRWRTLVKLPAKYADEIVAALRIPVEPQGVRK